MKVILVILLIAITAVAAEGSTKVRREDIDKEHVTVYGITVGTDLMRRIYDKLERTKGFEYKIAGKGKTSGKERKNAICYVSVDHDDATRLLFVSGRRGLKQGRILSHIRIAAGDVKQDYLRWCMLSRAVSKDVATASGLKLGLTPAEVKSILGDPTDESIGFLGYEFHLQRKLTEAEIKEIELERPSVRKYPYHDTSSSIEARFSDGILKRLDIIRFSTY